MKITFENADINFYFSFQCPYSYLAWKNLCDMLKDVDSVSVNPINIGINPPGNSKFSFIEYWSGERWLRLSKEAQKLGIIISKPLKIVPENLVAECIKKYDVSSVEYYISTIFKAVFSTNLDISISTSLRYFLQSEGNDSEIMHEISENIDMLDDFDKQIELWSKKRIRTLPTIEIGSERLAGFITKTQFENLLRTIID